MTEPVAKRDENLIGSESWKVSDEKLGLVVEANSSTVDIIKLQTLTAGLYEWLIEQRNKSPEKPKGYE